MLLLSIMLSSRLAINFDIFVMTGVQGLRKFEIELNYYINSPYLLLVHRTKKPFNHIASLLTIRLFFENHSIVLNLYRCYSLLGLSTLVSDFNKKWLCVEHYTYQEKELRSAFDLASSSRCLTENIKYLYWHTSEHMIRARSWCF